MLEMNKGLGKYGLANVEDTNRNGAVYTVMMTMVLLFLDLIVKKCDKAEMREYLTQYESKVAKKSGLVAKSSGSEILSGW